MKGGIYINQLFLVGRLVRTPEIKNTDGKLSCIITLAVKRARHVALLPYQVD